MSTRSEYLDEAASKILAEEKEPSFKYEIDPNTHESISPYSLYPFKRSNYFDRNRADSGVSYSTIRKAVESLHSSENSKESVDYDTERCVERSTAKRKEFEMTQLTERLTTMENSYVILQSQAERQRAEYSSSLRACEFQISKLQIRLDIYEGNKAAVSNLDESSLEEYENNVLNCLKTLKEHRKVLIRRLNEKNERDKKLCILCYEKDISTILKPCRHACMCKSCASKLEVCPICKTKIYKCKKVFL